MSHPISLRLGSEDLAAVDRAVAASGLSRSEWLRQVVVAAAGSRALLGPLQSAQRRAERLAAED